MNISQNFLSPGASEAPTKPALLLQPLPSQEDEGLHSSRLPPPPRRHHRRPGVQDWILFRWVQYLPTWFLWRNKHE